MKNPVITHANIISINLNKKKKQKEKEKKELYMSKVRFAKGEINTSRK